MTSASRLRVTAVRESTPGTTPTTPRMRTVRLTGESLARTPEYMTSDEIRTDRMNSDPILGMISAGGGINFEFSYPVDESPMSEFLRSAMYSTWMNTPQRFNDGTADSVITAVTASSDTYTVTAGDAFAVGHLVRATGFTNAANNGIFRAQAGSNATSVVAPSAPGLADETAPPGTARLKVVGFQGASGDITATASGLGSTALDFTTLGPRVGQWIKVGGTAVGNRFNTGPNNAFVRITAISANALTLDNLPVGWAIDAGTGKTISVWFGDQIKNGVTDTALTIEKGFMGQAVPNYITYRGMRVSQAQLSMSTKEKVRGSFTFAGMGSGLDTTSLDASPDVETTNAVMSANVDVGRITEAGANACGSNFIRSLEINVNNNTRMIESICSAAPVDVQPGEATVTGRLSTYFTDNALLTKFYNNTPTSLAVMLNKNSQAFITQVPRVTYTGGGNPAASGKNTDVMVDFEFTASKSQDGTDAHLIFDRLEYFEA